MSTRLAVVASMALMLTPLAARANPLLFTFSDPAATAGPAVVTFELDSNPTPSNASGDSFMVSVTDAMLNGVADPGLDPMSFEDSIGQGGLASGDGSVSALGEQVYTGDIYSPAFAPDVFTLFDLNDGGIDTLTISALSAAPEPETWSLLVAGVGLAGLALRRRSRRVALG